MSWEATAFVAGLHEGVTRSEKMLLLCLANRHNHDKKHAWISVPKLALDAMMSERTVFRLLDSLEKKRVISITTRPGQTSEYRFVGFDTPAVLSGVTRANVTPTPDKPEPEMTPTPDRSVTPTPDIAVSPKPALEPAINRQEPAAEPIAAAAALNPWQEIRPDFENTLGLLGGVVLEEARQYAQLVPALWFHQALEITRDQAERPNWKFTKAVLDRALSEQRPPKFERKAIEPNQRTARGQLLARMRGA